jgi:hypothetical protein
MRTRFFSIIIIATLLSVTSLIPVQAVTVKNGVSCSKSGANSKVGSKSYRCGKNPYFKPTQLTWTLRGCFTAYALWQSSKKQYEDFKDIAKLAGTDGEKVMNDLLTSIASLEDTMKNEACKKGA